MAIALFAVMMGVAALAWLVAMIAMIGMLRTANVDKLKLIWHAGWWNWEKVEDILGPEGGRHVRRFKRALICFFAAIAAGSAIVLTQIALESK